MLTHPKKAYRLGAVWARFLKLQPCQLHREQQIIPQKSHIQCLNVTRSFFFFLSSGKTAAMIEGKALGLFLTKDKEKCRTICLPS